MMLRLKINKRFQALHRQQTEEERKQLEVDILEEGEVRDAIVVRESDHAILDGHNRYEIARKHSIPFKVTEKNFADELSAEKWILRNQLGRRNLSPHDFKITLGRLYNDEKIEVNEQLRSPGGHFDPTVKTPEKTQKTAERLAEETGTSAKTVKRAGKRAEAYDKCIKAVQTLVDEKPSRASDKAVIELARKSSSEQTALAREVRTGQKPTFDVAIGLKIREEADNPAEPEWKVLKRKAIKTAEALSRAIDDLNRAKRLPKRKNEAHTLVKQLHALVSDWGT